ncbi:MAG: response regulator [Pseudomonadales bacterium]|nr:response regulator [Pseudomonadales bacterium]MCP5183412.1 response regulator [Pseudomonadales bacterium]
MARILVVEDSPIETHQFVNLLVKHGHQVLTATSGDDGLALAREEVPDAILMDVVLPGMNGFQATRQITRGAETRHIPVIMISSKKQPADRVWGERQGASAYMVKPVNHDALIACLDSLLQSRKAAP